MRRSAIIQLEFELSPFDPCLFAFCNRRKDRIRILQNTNKERKITLVITSHDMADIEKLCSRVIIIDKGRIIYQGDFDEIRHLYGKQRTLEVEFAESYKEIALPFGMVTKDEGMKKAITFLREQGTAIDLIAALGKRYQITDVSIQEAEIEAIIREIYEGGVVKGQVV